MKDKEKRLLRTPIGCALLFLAICFGPKLLLLTQHEIVGRMPRACKDIFDPALTTLPDNLDSIADWRDWVAEQYDVTTERMAYPFSQEKIYPGLFWKHSQRSFQVYLFPDGAQVDLN